VVVNELRGEKIDVIRWSPDPATYIANALSPARVDEVRLVNSEERQAHVLVAEDQLSLAIGKEGQNVRLAARLTGWKIDIKDSARYDHAEEDRKLRELQSAKLAAETAAAEARAASEAARQAKLAALAAASEEIDAEERAAYGDAWEEEEILEKDTTGEIDAEQEE
jgi:N utilization substance protein A